MQPNGNVTLQLPELVTPGSAVVVRTRQHSALSSAMVVDYHQIIATVDVGELKITGTEITGDDNFLVTFTAAPGVTGWKIRGGGRPDAIADDLVPIFKLKVAYCVDADCANVSISTLSDQSGAALLVGRFSSVTIGMDGLPIISYHDEADGRFNAAHCSNLFCVPHHRPR